MIHSIEEIKEDLIKMTDNEFYEKYIVRSDNWYFEKYLGIPPKDLIKVNDDYRLIISKCFNVSINSIMMVGSGKTGFSFSPPNPSRERNKTLQPFEEKERTRKESDIDIAIISNDYFHRMWNAIRKTKYNGFLEETYKHVSREIFRGFISERNITEFFESRRIWEEASIKAKRTLMEELYLKHSISFRIYRNENDFKEYNLQGIAQLKGGFRSEVLA